MNRRYNQKHWTKEENAVFFEHYRDKGAPYVGKLLGIDDLKYITMHARFLKLKLDKSKMGEIYADSYASRGEKCRQRRAKRTDAIDWDTFIPLTDETIYLLGYIWADGCVREKLPWPDYYEFTFSIVESDAQDIAHLMNKMIPSIPLIGRRYTSRRANEQPMFAWHSGKWEVGHWFYRYDYHVKSASEPTKILQAIPEEKHYLFFRGYSDGDGHIRYDPHHFQWGVSAPLNQTWSFLQKAFARVGINQWNIRQDVRSKGGTSMFLSKTKADARKWCEYIYQNRAKDGIGLNRKYAKFKQETDDVSQRGGPWKENKSRQNPLQD